MGQTIILSYFDIIIASALILVTVGVSLKMQLNVEKTLLIASFRTIVQLSFIGLILTWIFAQQSLYFVLSILTFITLAAAWSAKNRIKHPYKGLLKDTTIAIAISGWVVALIGLLFIINVEPWYTPRYAIPILGLILGNTLTGIALATDNFITAIHQQRQEIELHLSLSSTAWESVRPLAQNAMRSGMMPTINSMMVVGLVSLPGMMTGQILAGANPVNAVKYQIVTMFLISAAASLGCIIALRLVFKRFFNENTQLIMPSTT